MSLDDLMVEEPISEPVTDDPASQQFAPQADFGPEELFAAYRDSIEPPVPGLARAAAAEIPQRNGIPQRGGEVSGPARQLEVPAEAPTEVQDPLEVAKKVNPKSDDIARAVTAARVERQARQHTKGVPGVDEDLVRFKDVVDSNVLAGGRAGRTRELWAKLTEAPTSLSDDEEIELFHAVRQVAESAKRIASPSSRKPYRVDLTETGVIELHEWSDRKAMPVRNVSVLAEAAVALSNARNDTVGYQPTGEPFYVAEAAPERAAELNHLYPAVTGKSDLPLWVDSRPNFVQNVETIRRRVDADDNSHGETFLNTDIAANGGWHGFSTDDAVVVELERGQKLRLPRNVPPAVPIGVSEVDSMFDDGDENTHTRRPRVKVLVQPGPDYEGKLGELADELEIRGATNPVIYQHGGSVKGFQQVREHVWTDGVQTYAARFRDAELAKPNAGYAWVRNAADLPETLPPTGDENQDFGDGQLLLNGSVLVDAGQEVEPAASPFNLTRDGQKPVSLGVTTSAPPMITPLWDEGQEANFDAIAKRVGREVQVSSGDQNVLPAIEAGQVLKAAAVPGSLVLKGKNRFSLL